MLFPQLAAPRSPDGIDIRLCDVGELCREVRGARLVCADPPWRYAREAGVANPEENGIYDGLSEPEIVAHLDAAWDVAGPSSRLACWYTWPKAAEWIAAGMAGLAGGRW